PGQATTLYNNSVNTGGIISGYLVSKALNYGGSAMVFRVGIVFTALALILLFFVRKVKVEGAES
ncbi:MAG: hypothetical protein VZQ98_17265, partial [Bacteroidales bacterium]|nr:hypothetical protein [Bacteroidales bacterium]